MARNSCQFDSSILFPSLHTTVPSIAPYIYTAQRLNLCAKDQHIKTETCLKFAKPSNPNFLSVEGLKEARKSQKQAMTSIGAKVFDKGPMRKIPLSESGMLKNDFEDMCDQYNGFQTEAGKSADARILRLLEFFRHLYYRRAETFRKIVPSGLQDEFVELFDKIGALFSGIKSKQKVNTIQRSLSVGQRSLAGGSDLKLDRFKVRTVRVDDDHVGDEGNNTSGGAKDVKGR